MSSNCESKLNKMGKKGRKKQSVDFAHKIKDIVLIKWKDDMFYYGQVVKILKNAKKCIIVFDDRTKETVRFDQVYNVNETTGDIEFCMRCKKTHSDPGNELVFCDSCHASYHQLCHEPNVSDKALVPDAYWQCIFCERREPCPFAITKDEVLSTFMKNSSDESTSEAASHTSNNGNNDSTSSKQYSNHQDNTSQTLQRKRKLSTIASEENSDKPKSKKPNLQLNFSSKSESLVHIPLSALSPQGLPPSSPVYTAIIRNKSLADALPPKVPSPVLSTASSTSNHSFSVPSQEYNNGSVEDHDNYNFLSTLPPSPSLSEDFDDDFDTNKCTVIVPSSSPDSEDDKIDCATDFTEITPTNNKAENGQVVMEKVNNRPSVMEKVNNRQPVMEKVNNRQSVMEKVNNRPSVMEKVNNRQSVMEKVNNRPSVMEKVNNRQSVMEKVDKTCPKGQQDVIAQIKSKSVSTSRDPPTTVQQSESRSPSTTSCVMQMNLPHPICPATKLSGSNGRKVIIDSTRLNLSGNKKCSLCGSPAIYLCSGCQKVWYCDASCQLKAWPDHMKKCDYYET